MIGTRTKKTIYIVILSKDFRELIHAVNHYIPPDDQKFPFNYEDSSKGIELIQALTLVRHIYKKSG